MLSFRHSGHGLIRLRYIDRVVGVVSSHRLRRDMHHVDRYRGDAAHLLAIADAVGETSVPLEAGTACR